MRYSASCNIRNAILAVYIGALVSAALGNSDESLKSINVLGRGLAASDDLTVSKYLEAADSDSSRSSVEMSQDPAEAAPVTNSRYAEGLFDKLLGDKASYGKGSKKSKFCDFLRHADSSMDKLLIGRVAESLGFANAFANVGSIFDSNCKVRHSQVYFNHPTVVGGAKDFYVHSRGTIRIPPQVVLSTPTSSNLTFARLP